VQILDPATGTGTFIIEAIYLIYNTLHTKWSSERKTQPEIDRLWTDYVQKHLLTRIWGFELMMAPYAIAHMKISLKLTATRCYMSEITARAQIYLTNTLEEPKDFPLIETVMPALAHEAEAANRVKRNAPITVVLGNPPYSGHSENTGDWIMDLLRGHDTVTNEETGNYFEVDGQSLNERNPKWLNDDYVKFIRYSQRLSERVGTGILSFISNNGYLDNPTFRGMRQNLTQTYNRIYLLDLHGSAKKKEKHPDGSKDENVFDIELGVGIGVFARTPNTEAVHISHAHLFGLREVPDKSIGNPGKYKWLSNNRIGTTEWRDVDLRRPFYLFIPQDSILFEEFQYGWKITEMMPTNVLGFQTHRDHFAIDFDKAELKKRIENLRDEELTDVQIRGLYDLKDNRDWQLRRARSDV